MKVKYTGSSGVRTIGPYQWDASNGYIQDVTDKELLEDLQTYPRPDWEFPADNEPAPEPPPVTAVPGIGPVRAAELADHGIRVLADLAAADIEHLARHTGASRSELKKWVAYAQEVING